MILKKFKQILTYEKTILILLPLLSLLLFVSSIDVKYSVAGDATGKWLQTRDVITKPLFDFSCSYKYEFDKDFKYIPGAGYFYFFADGKCSHMYAYGFAYIYAPFLYFFGDYGIYLLNYLSWLIFIFSFASLTKLAVRENDKSYFYGGLFAVFISPCIIYAIGTTEVTLSFVLATYCLYIVYKALKDETDNKNSFTLILAGLILGLVFSLRTESIIFTASLYFSAFIYSILNKKDFKHIFSLFVPLVFGLIAGLALVTISHYMLFGNILGFRGMNAAKLITGNFSIKNQLEIVYIQLFAGNRGLFTSMPIILFSFAYLLPKVRNKFKEDGLFFFLTATLTTLIIVSTTPWGDFADWTPRYLALAFAPFFVLVLQICISYESDLLKNNWIKRIFIFLLIYSILFNLFGVILTVKITNMVKEINIKIEGLKADSIVLDTLIPYIYISQHNVDKPIFSLRLEENDSEDKGKQKLIELVEILENQKQDRKILIIQVEGISKFMFSGNEINGWKPKETSTLMKKIKFLLIEK